MKKKNCGQRTNPARDEATAQNRRSTTTYKKDAGRQKRPIAKDPKKTREQNDEISSTGASTYPKKAKKNDKNTLKTSRGETKNRMPIASHRKKEDKTKPTHGRSKKDKNRSKRHSDRGELES